MARLDSDLLRTFLAIVEAGSVTGGAGRIHRSQSATSLQLKQLEAVVGQPLLERHGRGVVLTAAGQRLFPVARQVIDSLDRALASFRTDNIEGRLKVGIAEDAADGHLADVLAAFCRTHPRVELEVHCAFGEGFSTAVSNGKLDLAVYEVPEVGPTQERLYDERLVWMAARHCDAACRDPLPIAVFDRSCWWRNAALADLEASGRAYRIVFSSENVLGVRAAVAAGMAVALLKERAQDDTLISLPEMAPPRSSHTILDVASHASGDAMNALRNAIQLKCLGLKRSEALWN